VVIGLFLGNDLGPDIDNTIPEADERGELTAVRMKTPVDESGNLVNPGDFGPRPWIKSIFDFLERFNAGRLIVIFYGRQIGYYLSIWSHRTELSPIHQGILDRSAVTALEYLRKTHELLKREGKRLVVFIIPDAEQVGIYSQRMTYTRELSEQFVRSRALQKSVSGWLESNRIEHIDPSEAFIARESSGRHLYFEWDRHWTVEEHRLAAELIQKYLRTHAKPE